MVMVSNSYSIVFFSDFGFGQLLTPCDFNGPNFIFSDVGDQAPRKDQGKSVENLVSQVEYVIKVQNTGNAKDKVLENLIGNKHASIDIAVVPKSDFVDEAIEIFIK